MCCSCDEQLWLVTNGGALWRADVGVLYIFCYIIDVFQKEKTILYNLHAFSSISDKWNHFLNECKVVVLFEGQFYIEIPLKL